MIEPALFRQVLGHYPTGVCAVTAVTADGERLAIVVGSFSSVSLDPPLVGFFPDKKSSTWPKVEAVGRFCVNVLGAADRELCRQLATSGGDKFGGVSHSLSANGSPILDAAIAWIDCTIEQVVETGDHYLVLGRVHDLKVVRDTEDPMLFFRGRYGGFADVEHGA